MRFIPTRAHAVIDYLFGLVLVLAPFVLGFATGGPAQWVPILLGLAILGMSLITDYEISAARIVPMPAHLLIDAAGGVLLAASPWLFGFANQVYWPHLVLGLVEVGTAAVTKTTSEPVRPRAV